MHALPLALSALAVLAPPASAEDEAAERPSPILAYEPFSAVEPGGWLTRSAGGFGWGEGWRPATNIERPFGFSLTKKLPGGVRGMHDGLHHASVPGTLGSATAAAIPLHVGGLGNQYISMASRALRTDPPDPGETMYVGVLVKPEGLPGAGGGGGGFGLSLTFVGHSGATRVRGRRAGHAFWTATFGFGKSFTEGHPGDGLWSMWDDVSRQSARRVVRAYGRPFGPKEDPAVTADGKRPGGAADLLHWTDDLVPTDVPVVAGKTTLLIYRFDLSPDGTTARTSLHVDPDPTAEEPVPPAVLVVRAEKGTRGLHGKPVVTLLAGGAVTYDELRVATTFAGAAGHEPEDLEPAAARP